MVDQLEGRLSGRPCDAPSHPVQGLQRGKYLVATALALAFTFAAAVPAGAAPKPDKAAAKEEKRAEKRAAQLIRHGPDTVIPLRVTDVVVQNGQLVALVNLGTVTQAVPITFSKRPPTPGQPPAACPILHLMLGPINLDLLGLVVETSEICLEIDAQPGPGNLLGNLLCGLVGILDGPTSALTYINGLSATNRATLLDGIQELLNNVLALATSPAALESADCDILDLAIGPVDLDLLGLLVSLDDCDGGPVTVEISAIPGGGLLGNLLCGLAGLLDGGANNIALARQLVDIADAILELL